MRTYLVADAGTRVEARFSDELVTDVLLPLLGEWTALSERLGRRVVVFLSAPPGTGKSTLAAFVTMLAAEHPEFARVQSLPLDGFHYHQDHILASTCVVDGVEVPMREVKGALETFDWRRFSTKLDELGSGEKVSWPLYSRAIHDVEEDALVVDAPVVVVEGNWLLSSEEPWVAAHERCDDSVFLEADPADLAERLIDRKVRGGLTREEAERWYARSDSRNVERLLARHVPARVTLRMTSDGDYVRSWSGSL